MGEPGYYFTTQKQKRVKPVKQPMEADFDVQVREGHVEVLFRPTESHISFGILVDPKDIARLGRLSRSANVRHAKTGDTGDYSASEVEAVAGNVHSAHGWKDALEPVVARYRGKFKRRYFRADAAFANPEVYEFQEATSTRSGCLPIRFFNRGSATCSSALLAVLRARPGCPR